MKHEELINIGDSDLNADWIKHGTGHALELTLHEELAERPEVVKGSRKKKKKEKK